MFIPNYTLSDSPEPISSFDHLSRGADPSVSQYQLPSPIANPDVTLRPEKTEAKNGLTEVVPFHEGALPAEGASAVSSTGRFRNIGFMPVFRILVVLFSDITPAHAQCPNMLGIQDFPHPFKTVSFLYHIPATSLPSIVESPSRPFPTRSDTSHLPSHLCAPRLHSSGRIHSIVSVKKGFYKADEYAIRENCLCPKQNQFEKFSEIGK